MKVSNLWQRLNFLVPAPDCTTKADDYESIVWRDARPKPTIEEVQAISMEQLEAETHQQKFHEVYKQYVESRIDPAIQRRLQSLHASPKTNANQKAALEVGEDWVDTVEQYMLDNIDTPGFKYDFSQFDATCPFTENKYHKIIKAIKAIK